MNRHKDSSRLFQLTVAIHKQTSVNKDTFSTLYSDGKLQNQKRANNKRKKSCISFKQQLSLKYLL